MAGALTKADLATAISDELGFNMRESKETVDVFFDEITAALEEGDDVRLSGFGKLSLRKKKARPGRNPKNNEEYEISERTVVLFHSGPTLTESIKKIED
jgi:integration host factor subunit alpha